MSSERSTLCLGDFTKDRKCCGCVGESVCCGFVKKHVVGVEKVLNKETECLCVVAAWRKKDLSVRKGTFGKLLR